MSEIIHGDALTILRDRFGDESVQCCVTSPPYWGLRDYKVDGQIGLEKTPEEYVTKMVEVFREVRRVLKNDGTLFLNLGDSYFGSNQGRMADGTQVGGAKQMTNRGSVTISSGGKRPNQFHSDAPACDSDDRARQDSRGPDFSYCDLCDECRGVASNRKGTRPQRQSTAPCDDPIALAVPLDSADESPDVSPLGAPASTIAESSWLRKASCSHCANCGVCLAVLRSSSRDGRLCVRREPYNSDNGQRVSGVRNSHKDASGMAWLNYTLKPKDLLGIPWMVAFALRADGWFLRSDIIWAKNNPMPESVTDRPTKSHEYIFLLSKSERYYYDADAIAEPAIYFAEARYDNGLNGHGGGVSHKGQGSSTRKFKADKQRGHGRRYDGFNDRWDQMEKAQQCSGMRNKRSVWTVATQPFSASVLGCGKTYKASADCPEHGLRAFPENWRKAADDVPQAIGLYRIDGTDARHALAPVSVSASSSSHIHDGQPKIEPRKVGSKDANKKLNPSRLVDNRESAEISLSHTTHSESSHALSLDNLDSQGLSDVQIATPHSKQSRKKVSQSAMCGTASEETSSDTDDSRSLHVQIAPDDFYTHDSFQIDGSISGKCTCKAIITDHFSTFPPKLVEPCILAGCPSGGLVLDPFAGSGTTIAVAQQLGRRGVGIEMNLDYIAMAARRCAQQGMML